MVDDKHFQCQMQHKQEQEPLVRTKKNQFKRDFSSKSHKNLVLPYEFHCHKYMERQVLVQKLHDVWHWTALENEQQVGDNMSPQSLLHYGMMDIESMDKGWHYGEML